MAQKHPNSMNALKSHVVKQSAQTMKNEQDRFVFGINSDIHDVLSKLSLINTNQGLPENMIDRRLRQIVFPKKIDEKGSVSFDLTQHLSKQTLRQPYRK